MLPEMTVEVRVGHHHDVRPPTRPGTPEHDEQNADALILCQAAKSGEDWPVEVLDIFNKYKSGIDFDMRQAPDLLKAFKDYRGLNFPTWRSLVDFVEEDECPELMVIVNRYLKQMVAAGHAKPRKDRDFIDGGGTGTYKRYIDRLSRKGDSLGSLEKAFDVKAHYKALRPIGHMSNVLKSTTSAIAIACYLNPGHFSYVAGHAVKFGEVVDLSRDEYEMSPHVDMTIVTLAFAASFARSGAFVHNPEDNCAGLALAGLHEFDEYLVAA